MRKLPQLSPISYHDSTKGISLKCYADTIVHLKENNKRTLVAIRFGSYPESVRGMSDAMYGGISVEAEIEQHRVIKVGKRYVQFLLIQDGQDFFLTNQILARTSGSNYVMKLLAESIRL